MEALDLFRGAGGWSTACQQLGIEDDGVECMTAANETARAAGHKLLHEDVWTLEPERDYDGHIASPPCPTFSQAGQGKGRAEFDKLRAAIAFGDWKRMSVLQDLVQHVGDPRTALVLTPLHFWWRQMPQWVAWEQVPTVLPVWEACAEVMRESGYHVWTGNLQAEQYGVPQTRKRAILIAHRDREVGMPTPTHSRYYSRSPEKLDQGVKKWVSMAAALGWGLSDRPSPTITGGGTETGGAEPIAKLARYTGRPDWAYRRPATTVNGDPRISRPGRHNPDVPGSQQHGSTRVTVEEAGVLQDFPADYPWRGSKTKQYLQVGNAIPVGLARAILSSVTAV